MKTKTNEYFDEGCPMCGCTESIHIRGLAEYPEQFEKWFCEDCGWFVGVIDNGPYQSCREFENFEIE